MINWKSILSSFNDKPTLLEWLKLVEKALKESVLKTVTTEQDADKANTKLIFNFEDGTQIETGFFPTKGKDAAEITGATSLYIGTTNGLSKSRVTFSKSDNRSFYADIMAKAGKAVESFASTVKEVTDENTVNTITVNYDDQTSNTFEVISARGKQGADGVSITGIETVSDEVVGDETHTTLRAHYSNNTTDEFVVAAKNGKDGSSGGGKLYLHKLSIVIQEGSQAQLKILSQDSSKITSVTNDLLVKMISGLAANSFPPVYANIFEVAVVDGTILSLSVYNSYPFDVTRVNRYDIDMTQAQILDKVTEL